MNVALAFKTGRTVHAYLCSIRSYRSFAVLVTLCLGLLQLHLQILQSQTVLTMAVFLAIQMQLLTRTAAIAESTAHTAKLALLPFKLSPAATAGVS